MENNKINVPKELLANIDFTNTLLGGHSATSLLMHQKKNGYEVTVRVPGLAPEALRIGISGSNLLVYHYLPVFGEGNISGITTIPNTIGNLPLPPNVDVDRVSAHYKNHLWHIFLPVNPRLNNQFRNIDIDY